MPKKNGQGGSDLDDPSLLEGDDLEGGEVVDDGIEIEGAGDDVVVGDGERGAERKQEGEELEIEIEAGADDPDAEALPDAEAGDEERTTYSQAVQARIARERRIAREARARADSERAARIRAEQDSFQTQRQALEISETALEQQIKSTKASLVKAKEDGKSEEEVELQATLNSLQNRHGQIVAAKEALKSKEEEAKTNANSAAPNLQADQWKRRNPWFGNARYGEQTLLTQAIDRALAGEGYDKNSPEYFAELDRRIRRRMPELQRFAQQRGGQQRKDAVGGQQRRDGAAPVQRRDAPAAVSRPGKVILTRSDFTNMRQFGMDPNNKDHQKEYARNKMSGGTNG